MSDENEDIETQLLGCSARWDTAEGFRFYDQAENGDLTSIREVAVDADGVVRPAVQFEVGQTIVVTPFGTRSD